MSVIVLGGLLVCEQVIAAPDSIDQDPAAAAPGIPWLTVGMGIVSLVVLLRMKKFLRLPSVARRRLLSPMAAGTFALGMFLAPSVGIGVLGLVNGDSAAVASSEAASEAASELETRGDPKESEALAGAESLEVELSADVGPDSDSEPVSGVPENRAAAPAPPDSGSSGVLKRQLERSLAGYFAQGLVLAAFVLMYPALLLPLKLGGEGRRFGRARAMGLGVVAIAVAWPLVQLTGAVVGAVLAALGDSVDPIAHDTLRLIAENPTAPVTLMTIAVVVIVAPVLEEVLYRGLIQDALRSAPGGPWTAIILTSLFFASRHIGNSEVTAVVALFVLSVAFGWAYERSGRLSAPITMHILFNLGNVGLLLLSLS